MIRTALVLCAAGQLVPVRPDRTALERQVVAHHAALVFAMYSDSADGAAALQSAVERFLASPSAATLQDARQAWLSARVPYLQTEVCRFYEGPIEAVEGLVNAWPIDERYIDAIVDAADKHPELSTELITSLNEKEGEKNISSGYHAIEFLLWGEDQSATGPGDRSHRDYLPATRNAERRGQYLRVTTRLLVEHLRSVAKAWTPGDTANYRAGFLAQEPGAALTRVLKGLGILSGAELAGERLTVPYATKEQEDEHSCFSDSTHQDIVNNALGIQNVYLGRYVTRAGKTVEGPGLRELVQAADPALAGKLADQIAASLAAARSIPAPFDQAIQGKDASPSRVAIKAAIRSLEAQTRMLAQAAAALGLRIDLQEPRR